MELVVIIAIGIVVGLSWMRRIDSRPARLAAKAATRQARKEYDRQHPEEVNRRHRWALYLVLVVLCIVGVSANISKLSATFEQHHGR